ncbi:TBC1 domain family member 6, partial [Lecanoromycetidae sp. Uapishka_2]
MTVDDAIEMYAAGFADDDEVELGESRDTSMSEEETRRSMKIAEAINDSMGQNITPTRRKTSVSTTTYAIISGDAFQSSSALPPPILAPTSARDQYGFVKASHHINLEQHDAWWKEYLPSQERRGKKWKSYMRDYALPISLPDRFPKRSEKTERFVRKGIPPAWRGPAWFYYAGGQAYLDRHPREYRSLVFRSKAELPPNDQEAIERDLHRTFPDNIHFKPDSSSSSGEEPPLLTSLRRVLRAFALHTPRIGYCQSLNFIAGLLLLFLQEEKVFWMLHIITTVYLPGTHEISLEGANVDLWVLMVALKGTMPSIWTKVGAAGTPGDDLIGKEMKQYN